MKNNENWRVFGYVAGFFVIMLTAMLLVPPGIILTSIANITIYTFVNICVLFVLVLMGVTLASDEDDPESFLNKNSKMFLMLTLSTNLIIIISGIYALIQMMRRYSLPWWENVASFVYAPVLLSKIVHKSWKIQALVYGIIGGLACWSVVWGGIIGLTSAATTSLLINRERLHI